MRRLYVLPLAVAVLLCSPFACARAAIWHGSAEGIRIGDKHGTEGTPPDDFTVNSVDNYQVTLRFSFELRGDGSIAGTGSGRYDDAHWHLEGHNGTQGDFSCDPQVAAGRFRVTVRGRAHGERAHLSISLNAKERNEDYDCGAGFTGFATTSHYISDSLKFVGGDDLVISLRDPKVPTLRKSEEVPDKPLPKHREHIWSFSFTAPDSRDAKGRGGGSGGTGQPGGGGHRCRLALSALRVQPASPHVGEPTTVHFSITAPARARLLVAPTGAGASTVVTQDLGAGPNALLWGGWLGPRQAPPGHYDLTVEAKGCGRTRRRTTTTIVT